MVIVVVLRLFIVKFILDKLVLLLFIYPPISTPPTLKLDKIVVLVHNIL